ncbi:MAG: homoserine dehydrogenase [Candidatus Omnitrophica bacterium]|nr:homoserine dehydrogenase [Candidatus Omnitrophota bacterium]MDE2223267.1 homoserine dehydrogenase [Candidatus Omnitrophota bacterium]
MDCLNIGLIGYGVVGQGVVKALKSRRKFLRAKYETDFFIKTICDRSIQKKTPPGLDNTLITSDYNVVLNDPNIHVVVELIGGLSPAKEIVLGALRAKKHVVTANKALIAECGLELFKEAEINGRSILFESSVGAGIPIIRTITEGMAGNKYNGVYGIINGTCNYILTSMSKHKLTFAQALKEAQEKGYAESNPTLDITGMDAAYKLAILVFITMGKFVNVKDIYVEGINHISHDDIEFAESLGLNICLLAIAKKTGNKLDVRVHPTMIPKDHGLATVNGVDNAVLLDSDPLGDVYIEGHGAGQMTAAMGVVADLINLGIRVDAPAVIWAFNPADEVENLSLRRIEEVETRFYIRFMVIDKPGVLASITTVLGQHNISIASVSQKQENKGSTVPVVILTHQANEKEVKQALDEITGLAVVKGRPVAIRMEKL